MGKNRRFILKVIADLMRAAPLSCIVIILYYTFNGFYPGLVTYLSQAIFQAAEQIKASVSGRQLFFSLLTHFITLYLLKNLFDMVVDAPRSCGIYVKVQYVLDRELADRVSKLPYIEFEDTRTHDRIFMARQAVRQKHFQKVFFSTLNILSISVGFFSIAAVLWAFNPLLLPLSVISVIPQLISRIIRGREFYELKIQQVPQRREANYYWNLFANPAAVKEMRSYRSQNYIFLRWRSLIDGIYNSNTAFTKKESCSLLLCRLLQDFGLILCILLCCWLVLSDRLSVSEFAASISAAIMSQTLFKNLMIQSTSLFVSLKFVVDYYDVMAADLECSKGAMVDGIRTISFSNVYFQYPMGSNYAIRDASFSISLGETIVIVGENGSGKTTLSKLILGLYEPTKGTIRYDNATSKHIDKDRLYQSMSVLPQNFTKYKFTIQENISIANPNTPVNIEEIRRLLLYVNLGVYSDFRHLNTILGKDYGGIELSGGEWQRLAIARALYKKCDLLVLDEPTSALDPAIESEVLRKFVDLTKNRQTTVIISHRVGLCPFADKIIVVKDGSICGVGTHQKLYNSNPYYHMLFEEQKKWYV